MSEEDREDKEERRKKRAKRMRDLMDSMPPEMREMLDKIMGGDPSKRVLKDTGIEKVENAGLAFIQLGKDIAQARTLGDVMEALERAQDMAEGLRDLPEHCHSPEGDSEF